MQVVNIADTGIFRAIGKPPNQNYDTLKDIVTDDPETTIQLPRPIYRELGGDPDAAPHPTGSSYVDTGIEEGWISVADPIEDELLVSDQGIAMKYSHRHCAYQTEEIAGELEHHDSMYDGESSDDRGGNT